MILRLDSYLGVMGLALAFAFSKGAVGFFSSLVGWGLGSGALSSFSTSTWVSISSFIFAVESKTRSGFFLAVEARLFLLDFCALLSLRSLPAVFSYENFTRNFLRAIARSSQLTIWSAWVLLSPHSLWPPPLH